MDSVVAEREGLRKDLEEVEAEIRRVQERLRDDGFREKAKPALVNEQHALLGQLEQRRVRIEENLAHVEERRPGGLPSAQSGTWSPLVLHEWAQPERHEEDSSPPVARAPLEVPRPTERPISREIADIVVKNQSRQKKLRSARPIHRPTGVHSRKRRHSAVE